MDTISRQTYSIEEFMALPDDGNRYELVKGELVQRAPAGSEHGEIGVNLIGYFAPYVRQNKLGRVFSVEAAFIINPEKGTVRVPDLAFVAAGRLPAGEMIKGANPLAPDLAVEIISPSDSLIEVEEKVSEYLEAGVRLVWVVNPRRKVVYIYRPGTNQRETLSSEDELDGEKVVPGFKLKIAEIFKPGE